MEHEHAVEEGAAWARTHPHEADRMRDLVTGVFAIKKCHENRPDDMLCPDCFREFIRSAHEQDPSLAESMSKGGYTWTRAWLRGLLRSDPLASTQ
jgi:hypothetical protein